MAPPASWASVEASGVQVADFELALRADCEYWGCHVHSPTNRAALQGKGFAGFPGPGVIPGMQELLKTV